MFGHCHLGRVTASSPRYRAGSRGASGRSRSRVAHPGYSRLSSLEMTFDPDRDGQGKGHFQGGGREVELTKRGGRSPLSTGCPSSPWASTNVIRATGYWYQSHSYGTGTQPVARRDFIHCSLVSPASLSGRWSCDCPRSFLASRATVAPALLFLICRAHLSAR